MKRLPQTIDGAEHWQCTRCKVAEWAKHRRHGGKSPPPEHLAAALTESA